MKMAPFWVEDDKGLSSMNFEGFTYKLLVATTFKNRRLRIEREDYTRHEREARFMADPLRVMVSR
jgi:hypothetical protein